MNIEKQIFLIISKSLNISENELNFESRIYEVQNWDSLGHIDIIEALEDNLHVVIENDAIDKILSIKEIINYLKK